MHRDPEVYLAWVVEVDLEVLSFQREVLSAVGQAGNVHVFQELQGAEVLDLVGELFEED